MQLAHLATMEPQVMGRSQPPQAQTSDPGSGPNKNKITPSTVVVLNLGLVLTIVGGIIAAAVTGTWAVSRLLNETSANIEQSRARIEFIERAMVTKSDLADGLRESGHQIRLMLGAGVITCDKFGGASTCKIMFPASAGE
jgi:hypothetical protein